MIRHLSLAIALCLLAFHSLQAQHSRNPAVVRIECFDDDNDMVQWGMGVVIAPNKIATVDHVCTDNDPFDGHVIQFRPVVHYQDGSTSEVRFKVSNHDVDMAILVVDRVPESITPLKVAESAPVGDTDIVTMFGRNNRVYTGVCGEPTDEYFCVPIVGSFGGESGCPMINCNGELVGLVAEGFVFPLGPKQIELLGEEPDENDFWIYPTIGPGIAIIQEALDHANAEDARREKEKSEAPVPSIK